MTKIAIDPGAGGGIAWSLNDKIYAIKMPDTPMDILNHLRQLAPAECCLERVGTYVPGNAGPGAVKFAEHIGGIKVALLATAIPTTFNPTPAKWQHWLIGVPNHPKIPKDTPVKTRRQILTKRKLERKRKIKETVQARLPGLKVTLYTADALGMLLWVLRVGG